MSNLAIVVGERRGAWALAWRRALARQPVGLWPDAAPPRVYEARYADDFFARLTPLDAAVAVWNLELRDVSVVGAWNAACAVARHDGRLRQLVVVGSAELRPHQLALYEMGAAAVLTSQRELDQLMTWVLRLSHDVARHPRLARSSAEAVRERLPWPEARFTPCPTRRAALEPKFEPVESPETIE